MSEPTGTQTLDAGAGAEPADDAEEHVSEYTTETSADAGERQPARKPVVTGSALGTGRRKEAIARVRIVPGTGQWTINGRVPRGVLPEQGAPAARSASRSSPSAAENQFDVIARITGGGITGQAGALRLGIARALILVDPETGPTLKKAGFLTRDPRVKERKKYGLKKARKAPQYSKR